jgi:hypothetical protein
MADAAQDTVVHAHPLARAVMRLLEHRDEADQRYVFAAAARRLRPSESEDRREGALIALERCAAELEVIAPTARTYTDWRNTSDAGQGAPSVQQIRTVFDGSWSRAVAAMPNVPSSDPLVQRLIAQGPRYTKAECLDALTRWHRETGEYRHKAYTQWMQRKRKTEQIRLPGVDAIGRRFGTWSAGVAAAGIDRPATGRPPRTRPPRVTNPTRQELIAALLLAYRDIGEPFGALRYQAWQQRKAAEHGGSDAPFRLPSSQMIVKKFGGRWSNAAAEALGAHRKAAAAQRQRQRRFTEDDLMRALWDCRNALGRAPRLSDYERWRHAQAERTGFEEWPPCEGSIRQRIGSGSWARACDRLQTEGPPDA